MPKLKTKSSAKKRFKISARGKVIMAQAGKRHGMIKRTNSQIRTETQTNVTTDAETDSIIGTKKTVKRRLIDISSDSSDYRMKR